MPTQFYDGEDLFRAWCEMGAAASNPRLIMYAKEKYGQASQMGPTYAMWHWAFYHPEQAFEMYKEWWFYARPEEPALTFETFVKILQKKGTGTRGINSNIASSRRDLERFCAKYGLDMDFRINQGDVIQVVRSNHPLYQVLMIVDGVQNNKVDAHYFIPDRVYPEANGRESVRCELGIKEIGVVGKKIV